MGKGMASSKKAPMKTASDVIKRVLWDEGVGSGNITVGYEDRFLGIMEKPFDVFNWCDFGSLSDRETAIPQHRIVYFKFRDLVVWDKRKRLDNIFGSTGGETLDQLIAHYDQRLLHAREAGEIVERVQHEVDEQVERRDPPSDEDRPNFFVCLRITDPALVLALRQVQCRALELQPLLHAALIPANKLHITLVTLRLNSEEEKQTAIRVLSDAQPVLARQLPASSALRVQGVDCFRDRCLYAPLAPACQTTLSVFVRALCTLFAARGLHLAGMHRTFAAHVTLAKLSRHLQRDLQRIDPAAHTHYGPDTELGSQPAVGLELCEMGPQTGPDGFYVRACPSVPNALPPPFLAPSAAALHALVAPGAGRRVVIMRGLPGSGKSSLARQLMATAGRGRAEACSADDYMLDQSGRYAFESERLARAHVRCEERFRELLGRSEVVVVDNTTCTLPELHRYLQPAQDAGYQVTVLETVCTGSADLASFHRRGTHAVPWSALLAMHARWVPAPRALLIDTRGLPAPAPPPAASGSGSDAEAEAGEVAQERGVEQDAAVGGDLCWSEGAAQVRHLYVFDMDGTLLNTPGRAEGVPAWEAAHGVSYPHPSWIDHPQSLSLPHSIAPGPVLHLWPRFAGRAGALTAVLTGRVEAMRGAVERTLAEHLPGGRGPDSVILKPAGCNTAEFKVAALQKLMAECGSSLQTVTVWDDDARNLAALARVQAEARAAGGPRVEVVDAVAAGLQRQRDVEGVVEGVVEGWVRERGLEPGDAEAARRAEAVTLLAGAWREALATARQLPAGVGALDLCRVYGGRRVGRGGDVDVCLSAPRSWTSQRCMRELTDAAAAMGLRRVHAAPSRRCPRVRVQLPSASSPPIDVDLVFTNILSPASPFPPAPPAFQPRPLHSGPPDGSDGVAFSGYVEATLAARGVGVQAAGRAVEAAMGVLGAHRMRGSHWQGPRACHVLEVARAAVAEATEEELGGRGADAVLRVLVERAARMSEEEWAALTNRSVSPHFVRRLPAVWARAAREIVEEGGISREGLERATAAQPVGAEWQAVRVRVGGAGDERWAGMMRLLAKLPVAFAALQDEGAAVEAGPSTEAEVWVLCGRDARTEGAVRARMQWLIDEVTHCASDSDRDRADATPATLTVQFAPLWEPDAQC